MKIMMIFWNSVMIDYISNWLIINKQQMFCVLELHGACLYIIVIAV